MSKNPDKIIITKNTIGALITQKSHSVEIHMDEIDKISKREVKDNKNSN